MPDSIDWQQVEAEAVDLLCGYLRIDTTAIDDKGLEHLGEMVVLDRLDLWKTKVSETGVARLKKALPRVRVAEKNSE